MTAARDTLADLADEAERLYGAMYMLDQHGPQAMLDVMPTARLREVARRLMRAAWSAQAEQVMERERAQRTALRAGRGGKAARELEAADAARSEGEAA